MIRGWLFLILPLVPHRLRPASVVTNYSSLLHFYDFSIVFFVYSLFFFWFYLCAIYVFYLSLRKRDYTAEPPRPLKRRWIVHRQPRRPLMDGSSNITSLDQQQLKQERFFNKDSFNRIENSRIEFIFLKKTVFFFQNFFLLIFF